MRRLDISANARILPAGEERFERGNDALPVRELTIDRDGRALTVWVGPVEPGGPERELWEIEILLG